MHYLPLSVAASFTCLALVGCGQSQSSNESEASTLQLSVERNHQLMDILFPEGTKAEVLGEGFEWTEGPLWVESEQMLLFSEIPSNTVYKWTETNGVQPYLKPSGYTGSTARGGEVGSNGLILSPDGQLILCQHGDRQMAVMDAPLATPQPSYSTLVGEYEGKRLNSPNDAVYDSQGRLYFTDPPYGLEKNVNDPLKELEFQGVYRFDPADGSLILLIDSISRPNGIHIMPGESAILIANSDPKKPHWYIYRMEEQGSRLGNGAIFYDASESLKTEKGLPDGLKVSSEGIVYATGPGGIWVFDANSAFLGKLKVGELISNVALNTDESFIYATADDYVIRIPIQKVRN